MALLLTKMRTRGVDPSLKPCLKRMYKDYNVLISMIVHYVLAAEIHVSDRQVIAKKL